MTRAANALDPRHLTPGVVLINPKFAVNVGNTLRACAAYGAPTLVWSGDRVTLSGHKRLPREERMKGYQKVRFSRSEKPIDLFTRAYAGFSDASGLQPVEPVCIELLPGTQNLAYFQHPENAVYVFGPEDGGVPKSIRVMCHHFVSIPSYHCVNLSQAVNVVLFHRRLQRWEQGLEPLPELAEERGFIE